MSSGISFEEKIGLCSMCFVKWCFMENELSESVMSRDPEISELFTSNVILNKFKAFGIDIFVPDPLILILDICCEGNPGRVQVVLKDLLNDIRKRRKTPIGYVISSNDFSLCFQSEFPIMNIERVDKKYMKMWDDQKKTVKLGVLESDNLCDTKDYWLEVMR